MGLGVQKARIEKVETNVDLKKEVFYITLQLKLQHDKTISVSFYEGDTIYSLYQILELYFGNNWAIDVYELLLKDILILKGEKSTDIAFSVPRRYGRSDSVGKWIILGSYNVTYTELEAKEILES